MFVEAKRGILVIGLVTGEKSEQIVELCSEDLFKFVKKLVIEIVAHRVPGVRSELKAAQSLKVPIKRDTDSYFCRRKIVINSIEKPFTNEDAPLHFFKSLAKCSPYLLTGGRSSTIPFVSCLSNLAFYLCKKVDRKEREDFFRHLARGYWTKTFDAFWESRPVLGEEDICHKESSKVFLHFHRKLLDCCTDFWLLTDSDSAEKLPAHNVAKQLARQISSRQATNLAVNADRAIVAAVSPTAASSTSAEERVEGELKLS